ncbi:hypothetical protein Tco_0822844 [Tanacetum coccineum]|uniref:Uncharacterized protein n=1 Tax=Tanacetum coccineum TaxID=301880 RepID=A0ABQ5AG84_9ASTR
MSETEPIVPTSTLPITDHILWEHNHHGIQTIIDPALPSVCTKDFASANANATWSIEDANLKFLEPLPSVWHVVATMIRGQPGLDELDFDDLYNNLKVYEHELKGVSNSSSPNIAFLSTEVKGSTLKQSTAEPTNIPKGYTQAASSKAPTAPNYASPQMKSYVPSFFNKIMPTTHDDDDLPTN